MSNEIHSHATDPPDPGPPTLEYRGRPTPSVSASHPPTPAGSVSRLAKVALIVSILGSPFVAGPLIFWSMGQPAGIPPEPTDKLINLDLHDIPRFMIATTLLSLVAMGRVAASGGRRRGMHLAVWAFLISLTWWPALLLLFFSFQH